MPLRKCIRVNTARISVADFALYAVKLDWQLSPVPWCAEAFFIERTDSSRALGKDLLHQLGYFYIQEASSMLPAVLLDPKPGEMVLDMSAAPGSKTTQMSEQMNREGIIIANDIQPLRLKTLQAACYRLGAGNVLLTQKKGQWFGQYMVEQFDRVLCDAPCSAQGTVRKDSTALDFFEQTSVAKMAQVQLELLEAAIAATKVGGRIVYSTCTLTFEENEQLVHTLLQKFAGKLAILSPQELQSSWNTEPAIQASTVVQESLNLAVEPMFRLWPQTYNSEGFFSVALQKNATTHTPIQQKPVPRREYVPSNKVVQTWAKNVASQFGTTFMLPHETLAEKDGDLFLAPDSIASYALPLRDYSLGIPYGKLLKDGTVRIRNELAIDRGQMATSNTVSVATEAYTELLAGKNATCDTQLSGDVIVQHNNFFFGVCLAQKGVLKNRLSREFILQS